MNAQTPGAAPAPACDEWQGLLAGVRDTLTDEMLSRLAATLGGALELADRLQRSRAVEWLPVLDRLAEAGALDCLLALAEPERLAKVQRLLPRLLDLFDALDRQNLVPELSRSLEGARRESMEAGGSAGGRRRSVAPAQGARDPGVHPLLHPAGQALAPGRGVMGIRSRRPAATTGSPARRKRRNARNPAC